MKDFAERLNNALETKQVSAAELSRRTGIDEGTISNYRKGKYVPKQRRTEMIADALRISIAWLMGADVPMEIERTRNIFSIPGIEPPPKTRKVPRLGTIACGEPIFAEQNLEDYDDVDIHTPCDFTLRCKGDSMINARINDGDIVMIQQQPTVDNGEIAAVLIDNEATLKRVYIAKDQIILVAENPKYQPITRSGEEMNDVRILGKATGFISKLN